VREEGDVGNMTRFVRALGLTAAVLSGKGVAAVQTTAALLNADVLKLEGRTAPPLEGGIRIGSRLPSASERRGKGVLLFFWAHWCADCKPLSPILARLLDKYRSRGLTLIAPTRLYGYAAEGRPAPPDRELRYVAQIRDSTYPFLRQEPVPVSEANYKQYGVDAIPLLVFIDRAGIVRLFHPVVMSEPALEAAIRTILE
jgi:thiol-disulfide isomerase/thioredoxin